MESKLCVHFSHDEEAVQVPTAVAAAADSAGDEGQQQRWNNDDAGHAMDDDGSNRHAKEGIAAEGCRNGVGTQRQRPMTVTVEAWP